MAAPGAGWVPLARATRTDPARRALPIPGTLGHTGLLPAQLLLVIISALQCSVVKPAAAPSWSFHSFVKVAV